MSNSCKPMDCSLPGSFLHWILQARILEWVAISFSGVTSWPRDQTQVSCIAGRFFYLTEPLKKNKASRNLKRWVIKLSEFTKLEFWDVRAIVICMPLLIKEELRQTHQKARNSWSVHVHTQPCADMINHGPEMLRDAHKASPIIMCDATRTHTQISLGWKNCSIYNMASVPRHSPLPLAGVALPRHSV